MNKKWNYNKVICIKNNNGFERVIKVSKVYTILNRTNRYITIKTETGNIQAIWKGYFKPFYD